ncbi:unnamed protein product [Protopolystoma xenopodis]|uniref:Uncharacterized protein n=1 Tax=Protopolystoma xenopodis TaxID=117903 RepID=A0A448WT67_9PLAT|nr:unnamed protein product [Protopolystoma xenopodis]
MDICSPGDLILGEDKVGPVISRPSLSSAAVIAHRSTKPRRPAADVSPLQERQAYSLACRKLLIKVVKAEKIAMKNYALVYILPKSFHKISNRALTLDSPHAAAMSAGQRSKALLLSRQSCFFFI